MTPPLSSLCWIFNFDFPKTLSDYFPEDIDPYLSSEKLYDLLHPKNLRFFVPIAGSSRPSGQSLAQRRLQGKSKSRSLDEGSRPVNRTQKVVQPRPGKMDRIQGALLQGTGFSAWSRENSPESGQKAARYPALFSKGRTAQPGFGIEAIFNGNFVIIHLDIPL